MLLVVAIVLSGVIGHDMIGLIETVATTLNVGLPFLGVAIGNVPVFCNDLRTYVLGVSLIAIVPTITEIINACKFALNNQIGTSIEIGSTVAVQTALLQIPLIIVLSEIITLIYGGSRYVFVLSYGFFYVSTNFYSFVVWS
jgi:Ca2+/H+ antiporter